MLSLWMTWPVGEELLLANDHHGADALLRELLWYH